MDIIFQYWFEILAVTFLSSWLIFRRNGTWQKKVTAHYEDTQLIKEDYSKVFRMAVAALEHCGFVILSKKSKQGLIRAKSTWTMKSFGEKIEVSLSPMNQGVEVHFYSRCKIETQLFDWGKNRKNTREFFNVLSIIT